MTFTIRSDKLIVSIIFYMNFMECVRSEYCTTENCQKYAEFLKSTMDASMDPCKDFYEFVCGKAKNETLTILDNEIYRKFRKILLEDDPALEKYSVINFIKKSYKHCETRNKDETPMIDVVKPIFSSIGKWPRSDDFKLTTTEFWLRSMEIEPIIMTGSVGSGLFILPNRNFMAHLSKHLKGNFGDEKIEKYFGVMMQMANALTRKWPAVEMRQALVFGMNLTKALEDSSRQDKSIEFGNLDKEFQHIPIKAILQNHTTNYRENPEKLNVLVVRYQFLKRFDEIVSKTDERSVENFLKWMIFYRLSFLTGDKKIYKILNQIEDEEYIEMRCKDELMTDYGAAFWWLYIYKNPNSTKADAMNLFDHIQKTIAKGLGITKGLDRKTKRKAQEKIEYVFPQIGYPDAMKTFEFIEKESEKIDPKIDSIVKNILKYRMNRWKFHSRPILMAENRTETNWDFGYIGTFNAFYFPQINAISINQPVLDTNLMINKGLKYLYYGNLGYIIGHEITHAIDSYRRYFNKYGKFENWWTENGEKWFQKKSQCLVEQYNSYYWSEAETHVKGEVTLNENIADTSIKFTYQAYKSLIDPKRPEEDLLGFENFTHPQLFWIANALLYCGQNTTHILKNFPRHSHSPSRFRIIGMMQNSEDFAKDFNCPRGSYMNPVNKCRFY